jgi:hypothetical protein
MPMDAGTTQRGHRALLAMLDRTAPSEAKDFSSVVYNDQHIVYMSTVDPSGSYGGAFMTFADWAQAATATQSAIPVGGVAPTFLARRMCGFSPRSGARRLSCT